MNELVIGTPVIEGVNPPVEGTHGEQMLGGTLEQLGWQKLAKLHPQRVAARGELLGVELPRGNIFLFADLIVARP